ncbi:hypothetical protein [Pseudomonas chlororaphis]|nr:hypothetical protein [Pseudomonas chlororaphis]MBP5075149.1 hypothetical protein [Pseudomonas chlororaphis]QTT91416.1 hypothetical protein HUT28_29765 [Pseudomonas chlororaphis]
MLAMKDNAVLQTFRAGPIAGKPRSYPNVSPEHEKSAFNGAFFMLGRSSY